MKKKAISLLVLATTICFTNAKAKTIVDRQIKSYKTQKEIKEKIARPCTEFETKKFE